MVVKFQGDCAELLLDGFFAIELTQPGQDHYS